VVSVSSVTSFNPTWAASHTRCRICCPTCSSCRGLAPFLEQLHKSGFTKRGGQLVCTYFEENMLSLFPAEQVDGMYSCLDYYQTVGDPFSRELLSQYDKVYPGSSKFTAGSAATGMYRGLKLWEAAVKEAGSLDQNAVIRALDHAKIQQGPGGPAEMVPGQHHVRLNMYIGQAKNGKFEVYARHSVKWYER